MNGSIRTQIVKIGNSQGIRIPKLLLEQSGINDEVEIEVQSGCLILRAVTQPRSGWEEAFASMSQQKDDALLEDRSTTEWDATEWEW